MSSNGPLIDLVAKGKQDVNIISNDIKDSLFQENYTKHTNFSRGSTTVHAKGSGNWGSSIKYIIPRDGDLLSSLYLNIKVPKIGIDMIKNKSLDTTNYFIKWSDFLGNGIIKKVILRIEGKIIVEQSGTYMQLHTDLYDDDWSKRMMLGHDGRLNKPSKEIDSDEIYVPLKFWFSDDPSKAIPLVAMRNAEIELEIQLRDFHQCYSVLKQVSDSNNISNKGFIHSNEEIKIQKLEKIDLEVMYVFLSNKEREEIALKKHKFLITQVQERSQMVTHNVNLELNLNHPVKEFLFIVQPDENIKQGELFNFSNKLDYIPSLYEDASSIDFTSLDGYNNLPQFHLLDKARILFNGIERISWKNYKYFFYLQNYEHFKSTPENFVYIYCFALYPTSNNPSGSCNFSRIDMSEIQARFSQVPIKQVSSNIGNLAINGSVTPDYPSHFTLFATNYNYLIIQDGMASLEFAN